MSRLQAYAADFETTTDADDCRVWAWGIARVDSPSSFRYGNDLDGFMQRLATLPPSRVYFHNLAFDGAFIFSWLLEHGWVFTEDSRERRAYTFSCIISDMNQVYCIGLNFERGLHIDVYDSLKILPMALRKVATTFGMEMTKGEIDYTAPRTIGHRLTGEELDYLKRDVLILAQAVRTMLEMGEVKMTAGSNALADYIKTVGGRKVFRRLFPIMGEDEDAFREASLSWWLHVCSPEVQAISADRPYHVVGCELALSVRHVGSAR